MTQQNYGPPTTHGKAVPLSPEEIAKARAQQLPPKPVKPAEPPPPEPPKVEYPKAVKVIHRFPFNARGNHNIYEKDQIFTDPILIREFIDGKAPVTGLLEQDFLVCEKCHHVQSKK